MPWEGEELNKVGIFQSERNHIAYQQISPSCLDTSTVFNTLSKSIIATSCQPVILFLEEVHVFGRLTAFLFRLMIERQHLLFLFQGFMLYKVNSLISIDITILMVET